jgi:hypothetical protein
MRVAYPVVSTNNLKQEANKIDGISRQFQSESQRIITSIPPLITIHFNIEYDLRLSVR